MYDHLVPARPGLADRLRYALTGVRDFLDERGRPAWIVAMILGFVVAGPLGLAILAYMIWSKRVFTSCRSHRSPVVRSTGNSAFDAYRVETLKRLEDEHAEFLAFLAKLREAKDKSEFDAFMDSRKAG